MAKITTTTLDMEIAVMSFFGYRQNLIVPNVSWGMWFKGYGALHECDILSLTPSGYATEIEIKVSKYDLINDSAKKHGHDHPLVRRLYFAVPSELREIALEVIPERAGLLVLDRRLKVIRGAKINPACVKWSDKDRLQLARLGAMRIIGLKQKIRRLSKVK